MGMFLVFALLVVISAYAQKWFFDAVAASDRSVLSDDDLAAEIREHPSGVIAATGHEVLRRLRALFRRQPLRALEVKRWLALASIALMVAAFAWVALTPG
jgi:hypothetical protein